MDEWVRKINKLLYEKIDNLDENLSEEERRQKTEKLTNWYYEETGKLPPEDALELMGDYLLADELKDKRAHKSRHYKYPVLSDQQLKRRKYGVHEGREYSGRNNTREISLSATETIDLSGNDCSRPVRRDLSIEEMVDIDIRNSKKRRTVFND